MTATRVRVGTFHLQRLCEEPGCERDHRSRGLCQKHYAAHRRAGDFGTLPECIIPGCHRHQQARGWCKLHWTRWQRTRNPLGVRTRTRRAPSVPKPPTYVLEAPDETRWLEQALCPPHGTLFTDDSRADKAKRICARCPVRSVCLADALARSDDWGIRGGFTAAERRVISGVLV